jgi:hypothetical protein
MGVVTRIRAASIGMLFALALGFMQVASAHPGASIFVAKDGRVFFVDTGGGIFFVDRDGRLVRHPGPGFHWFAMDEASRLAKTPWPSIPGAEIVSVGTNPTLVASSDFPVVVGRDGALYYPEEADGTHWRVIRVAPSGARTTHARFASAMRADGSKSSVNGFAVGDDGSLYFSQDRAVHRIDAKGQVHAIVHDVRVPDCTSIPGVEAQVGPYLRGLDVAPNGTVFVAAAGCGAVLMVSPKGAVTTVLRSRSPYSPTAVAVANGEIFVLEYLHTASDDRREWLPRVRKINRDGKIETVVRSTR